MKVCKFLAIAVAALWFGACTHTGSPKSTTPEKRPPENKIETPTESPDEARPVPQEPGGESEAGQASMPQKPDTDREERPKVPQTELPPSRTEADTKTEIPAENRNTAESATSETASDRLEEARQKLQTSRETEKRIAAEIERLKDSGNASAQEIEDYQAYLDRVRAMTAENGNVVSRMETAYARHTRDAAGLDAAAADNPRDGFDPAIPEERTVDEVAALDRELNASLAKFDDRLLKEMEAIRADSAKKLQDLAQEAADAAKRLRDKGMDGNTPAENSAGETSRQTDTSSPDGKTEPEAVGTAGETANRGNSGAVGKGSPADRHRDDYKDDDIVARQLREAAENETDPELKEKLWKEYEDYKQSR